MKSKTERLVAVLSAVTLLASCAQSNPLERKGANSHVASENDRKQADHHRLAKQYESTTRQLLAKIEEQRKLLQHYEEKSYLYGRQAQDRQSHTQALLTRYQHDAEETIKQAAFHHKMASEMAERELTAGLNDQESKVEAGIIENWTGSLSRAL